jgi:hypothetical protein
VRAKEALRKSQAARVPFMALVDKRRIRGYGDAMLRAGRSRDLDEVCRLLVAMVDEIERTGVNG